VLLAWGGMPAGRFPPSRFIALRLVECNQVRIDSAIPGGVPRLSRFPFEDDLIV
jgi:hypothetical protein